MIINKMINYNNIVLGILQYVVINGLLNRYQTKKLAANSCSFIHASSTVVLWSMGYINLIKYNTQGYFLFDTFNMLLTQKHSISNMALLYHHIAGTYYLSLNPEIFDWFNVAGVGELGNIPNYFVYYLLKSNPESVYLSKLKMLQKIWFGFIRIFPCSILTYYEVNEMNKAITLIPVIPLYFLGLVWTGVILKQ
jgi:hypothetical protein